MDKLDMQSKNLVDENIEKIAKLFPNCITEGKNEEGQVVKLVDFDLLKQELSKEIVEGNDERYTLNWAGKKQAILTANSPINATLRPCREESVNFDNTKNIYIEGDNLDVLKLLRETYLGKVKMIYIDPPYNTGNDFVYEDDFATSTEDYLQASKSYDEQGNRMFQNNESNGRFHSDWLSMMYSRLKLAKDMLADDGVIFISIDDNEQENLKKICNEIFGEKNFISNCIRRKNKLVMKGDKTFKSVLEPLLVYSKNKNNLFFSYKQAEVSESDFSVISAGYGVKEILFKAGQLKFREKSSKVCAGKYNSLELLDELVIKNYYNYNDVRIKGEFKWSQDKIYEKINSNAYILIKNIENMTPRIYFQTDSAKPLDYIDENYGKVTNEDGLNDLKKLNLDSLFSYPKPVDFIKFLLNIINDANCIVLDFFSGSATTAHAIMKLNAEDGGNRKFIMVQLPENCDEKSEAYKAGYKNICEIGKERIRRAGKKIKEELDFKRPLARQTKIVDGKEFVRVGNSTGNGWNLKNDQVTEGSETWINLGTKELLHEEYSLSDSKDYYKFHPEDLDIGFRVLKLDSSNMKDVYYNPSELKQSNLFELTSNIKEDRSAEDLLFQVMLDMGVMLSSDIKTLDIQGKKVFNVNDGNLVCCFDKDLTDEVVTEIAKLQPLYAVFRDSSMKTDSVAVNFDQIFETYSPTTTRKVL